MDYRRHDASTAPMAPWAMQVGGLCGIAFAVLSVAALATQMRAGFPPSGESAAEIERYFAGQSSAATWFLLISYLTIPFQLVFFCVLYSALRRRDLVSVWPLVGLVSAGLATGAAWTEFTNYASLMAAAPDAGDSLSLRTAWMQYHVGGFCLQLLSIPVLGGFGWALWRTGAWRLGGAALVAAVVCAIAFFADGVRGGAASPLGLLADVLFLAWIFAIARSLARIKSPSAIRRSAWEKRLAES